MGVLQNLKEDGKSFLLTLPDVHADTSMTQTGEESCTASRVS